MEGAGVLKDIFQTDEEYLQEYFKICELFMQKRDGFNKSRVEKHRNKDPQELAQQFNEDTTKLNYQIKEKDAIFWEKVKASLAQNKTFVIETLASHYALSIFEKRVLLFFLYLEFYQAARSTCSKEELLFIFDLDSSPISRMRSLKYFYDDSAIVKEQILIQNRDHSLIYTFGDFMINKKTITIISQMLNGESVNLKEEMVVKPSSSVDDIGYAKEPEYTLNDVILNDETKEKVGLFLDAYKDNKLEALGAFQKSKKGKGLIFLFYGPPGTGKSMLAEAIAHSLNKKMLMVEYPKITDRWLGETDKHISRIFKSARASDLVVVMDEADSLLYNRSSYAAQEHDIRFVNIMLQELEKFEGVIILTSNMDVLLDPALERRIGLKIQFKAPDTKLQAEIWKAHIPASVALSDEIDFGILAKRYDFPGGNIKNAVLNAVRKISKEKRATMMMEDLVFGADMERDGMFFKKQEKRIIGFSEKC